MSEEKKLENMEVDDESLEEVSGGTSVQFWCPKCKDNISDGWIYSGPIRGKMCVTCKRIFEIDVERRVVKDTTDNSIVKSKWAW